MFSADGLRDACQLMMNAQQPQHVTAIALRLRYGQNALNSTGKTKETVSSLMTAAGIIKRFHGSGGIIGRISDFEFLLLYCDSRLPAELLTNAIYTEMMYDADFLRYSGQVTCMAECAQFGTGMHDLSVIIRQMTERLDMQEKQADERRYLPHYHELKALHDQLYREPLSETGLQDAAGTLGMNQNHFNRIYRRCFGISFHQDRILARMRLAGHLLLVTESTVANVAEACGYTDSKYFIRQFSAETGYSPKQYRMLLQDYLE